MSGDAKKVTLYSDWKIPEQDVEEKKLLLKAKQIAYEAHAGQKDKAGMPYIEHPLIVSHDCRTMKAKIVGMLHDVIEDTDVTYDQLREAGFSEELLEALRCVTKEEDWQEAEYFSRIRNNPIAREVKLQDLNHNTDYNRVISYGEEYLEKQERYQKQMRYLLGETDDI